MKRIMELAKRRGFAVQSSEIYGGIRSSYDYGPLGVELKNNIGRPVLLADLDPAGGDVAAHLPVEDLRRGVAPLLGVVGSRLDAEAVAAESTMAGANLWVLNGLPHPDTAGCCSRPRSGRCSQPSAR